MCLHKLSGVDNNSELQVELKCLSEVASRLDAN